MNIKIRKGDWFVIILVVAAAVGIFIAQLAFAKSGSKAVVTTPSKTITLSLSTDTQTVLQGDNGIEVTIVVEGGRIRFEQSNCPDKICVHSGWLSKSGQSAACVPAGIAISVSGDNASQSEPLDAIAE